MFCIFLLKLKDINWTPFVDEGTLHAHLYMMVQLACPGPWKTPVLQRPLLRQAAMYVSLASHVEHTSIYFLEYVEEIQ